MGFFNDFSAIGKIYNKLKTIEGDLIEMQKCIQSPDIRQEFESASSSGVRHLQELQMLVDQAGSSVKCANFQFAGQNKPIVNHMISIGEYMKALMEEYTFRR